MRTPYCFDVYRFLDHRTLNRLLSFPLYDFAYTTCRCYCRTYLTPPCTLPRRNVLVGYEKSATPGIPHSIHPFSVACLIPILAIFLTPMPFHHALMWPKVLALFLYSGSYPPHRISRNHSSFRDKSHSFLFPSSNYAPRYLVLLCQLRRENTFSAESPCPIVFSSTPP